MSWTSSIRPPIASALAAARQHRHRHHHCRALSGVVECPGVSSGISRRRVASSSSSSSLNSRRRGFPVNVSARTLPSTSSSLHPPSSLSVLFSTDASSRSKQSAPPRRQREPFQRYFSQPSIRPSSSPVVTANSGNNKLEEKNGSSSNNNTNRNNGGEGYIDSSVDVINTTINSKNNDNNNGMYSILPPTLHPYARLSRIDKPIGTFLLLHPCLWSVALASSSSSSASSTASTSLSTTSVPTLQLPTDAMMGELLVASNSTSTNTTTITAAIQLVLDNVQPILPFVSLCTTFALGSFIMRSAGCTINDMWDASYDKSVERTKDRPLACGELTHTQAAQFLLLQLMAGLGILLSLPHVDDCVFWGIASLPLVGVYPLMKRYTHFPQVVLGMTFNWGAILGWVAVRGGGMHIDWSIVGPLYVAGIAWTVVYDTLYAHQDKKDDMKLGLKSTALTFGDTWTKPILTGCAAATWGGWMLAGYNCGFGTAEEATVALSALIEHHDGGSALLAASTVAAIATQYAYYAGVSAAATHMLWQIYTADLNDASNLAYRFKSNNLVGWIVFGSCCVAAGGSNLLAVG